MSPDYHWITAEAGRHRFLHTVFESFGFRSLQLWIEASVRESEFQRAHCGGLVTALGEFQGRPLAVVWSDFRVNAASYGRANSRRFSAFLRLLLDSDADSIPLVYAVNSAGLSLMEGRTVFSDAFDLWPALLDYADRHLVLTCATGKCLGLAPLLFGLGHYRVAVAGQTQINLTGPEVIRLFFGQAFDFERSAGAERFLACNDLVHETVPSVQAAFTRFQGLLAVPPGPDATRAPGLGPRSGPLLSSFLDATPRELIPDWCPRVRLFIGTRRGRAIGVFLNPPERSNNMITTRTLEKYAAGLDLFRALRLPIVSLLDSPGMDPRFDQSDANNIRKILWVGEKIIRYPHGAMGVVTGRCYGGAASLGFPKVFGGRRAVAIRGSGFGVMCDSIVDRVLSGSPRLREQWRRTAAAQGPGLEDLLEEGSLDAVIEARDLPAEVDRFLSLLDREPRALALDTRRRQERVAGRAGADAPLPVRSLRGGAG